MTDLSIDLSAYPPLGSWYALLGDDARRAFVRLVKDKQAEALHDFGAELISLAIEQRTGGHHARADGIDQAFGAVKDRAAAPREGGGE